METFDKVEILDATISYQMKQTDKLPVCLSYGTLYGSQNRMEADVHGTSKTKDAVIEADKYARQNFN